jgi:hypothetical protein
VTTRWPCARSKTTLPPPAVGGRCDNRRPAISLIGRATAIVLTPQTEWAAVDREASEIGDLFADYVAVLAAIPVICGLISRVLIGVPLGTALLLAIAGYALSFLAVYVMALVVDQLAPIFAGHTDFESALKLVVYSATPIWLSGLLHLLPALGFLSALGFLDAVYLLWSGIPALMCSSRGRALPYTGLVVVCLIVLVAVFKLVARQLMGVSAVM